MTTQEDFLKFEKVRKEGRTNMMDSRMVEKLGGPPRNIQHDIIDNYDKYADKWLPKVV